MKHLFVPFEIAKKLKEKGFDEPCFRMYRDGELKRGAEEETTSQRDVKSIYGGILAPVYQQVIDWLNEQGIEVKAYKVLPIDLEPVWVVQLVSWSSKKLGFATKYVDHGNPDQPINHFKTRTDAVSAAITDALKYI